jgi:hypothetical protein
VRHGGSRSRSKEPHGRIASQPQVVVLSLAEMAEKTGKYAGDAKEFYLKEYECLRREIEWLLQDYRTLERNVVLAIGVTWAWLFTHTTHPRLAWWIPVLFAVLGAIRAYGIHQGFAKLGNYIKLLEENFSGLGDPEGWQHKIPGKFGTSKGAATIWFLLVVTSLGLALYISFGCLSGF